MANDLSKAEWWRNFILARCRYPAPDRLRAQFANATLEEFCQCGCNSFAVARATDEATPPLTNPGGRYGMVFEADFHLPDEQTLEILLFTNKNGHLSYVEIDCDGNTFPVPEVIEITLEPFAFHASGSLLE